MVWLVQDLKKRSRRQSSSSYDRLSCKIEVSVDAFESKRTVARKRSLSWSTPFISVSRASNRHPLAPSVLNAVA